MRDGHAPIPWSPRASSVLVLSLLLSISLAAGCRTMTRQKEMELQAEKEKAENAAKDDERRMQAEAERKRHEAEARDLRERLRQEAAEALAGGDAAGAIYLIEQVFSPPPLERRDEATGKLEKVLVDPPVLPPAEEAPALVIKAGALAELNQNAEAIAAFEHALKLDPSNRAGRRGLGKLRFAARKYSDALAAWTPELADGYRDAELMSMVAQAQYHLGKLEGSQGRLEAARLAMQSVLLERPHDAEARRWLAFIEYDAGRYAEAALSFDAVLKEHPLDPDYLERAADVHGKLGNEERAMGLLQLSADIRPPSKAISRTLGNLYVSQGLPGRAAEWLARAHENNPGDAPPGEQLQIGVLLAEARRPDEAEIWLDAVPEGDASFAEAQARLVLIHAASGKLDEAAASYESAKRLKSLDGAVHLAAGDAYLKKEQPDQAIEAFSRACAIRETRAAGLAGLAEVSYSRGNLAAALDHYRKALELKPVDARLLAAVEQIDEEMRLGQSGEVAAAPTPAGGSK
ncbi:MAG TPA: tetratricopeptide repeat protein [Planctomycetota bacterium]|nr:tetratricopeptide repeat protein [Planctomycetota bacterium]